MRSLVLFCILAWSLTSGAELCNTGLVNPEEIGRLLTLQSQKVRENIDRDFRIVSGYHKEMPAYFLELVDPETNQRSVIEGTYLYYEALDESLIDPGMWVHPDYQQNGISTLLFLKALHEHRFQQVIASFGSTNKREFMNFLLEQTPWQTAREMLRAISGSDPDIRQRLIDAYYNTPFGHTLSNSGFGRLKTLRVISVGRERDEVLIDVTVQIGSRDDQSSQVEFSD